MSMRGERSLRAPSKYPRKTRKRQINLGIVRRVRRRIVRAPEANRAWVFLICELTISRRKSNRWGNKVARRRRWARVRVGWCRCSSHWNVRIPLESQNYNKASRPHPNLYSPCNTKTAISWTICNRCKRHRRCKIHRESKSWDKISFIDSKLSTRRVELKRGKIQRLQVLCPLLRRQPRLRTRRLRKLQLWSRLIISRAVPTPLETNKLRRGSNSNSQKLLITVRCSRPLRIICRVQGNATGLLEEVRRPLRISSLLLSSSCRPVTRPIWFLAKQTVN